MQIVSRTSNWIRRQTSAADDFRPAKEQQQPAPEPGLSIGKAATVGTAVGAGLGAVAGGAWAGHSVANDFEYFDYVSQEIPLASSGPSAQSVFGAELSQFQSLVGKGSEGTDSADQTLQYLSYLKHQDPKMSAAQLEGIYRSLEGQFGDDNQVREALNMIAAHTRKYNSTTNEAHAEFTNYFGYENDFGKASETFARDQKLAPEDFNETLLQYVKRHSSPIGHLGMARGVALGVVSGLATGAAVGAVAGVAVGVGVHIYNKLIS